MKDNPQDRTDPCLDYDLSEGMWDHSTVLPKMRRDLACITVHTRRFHDIIKEKTGKEIPLNEKVLLGESGLAEVRELIHNSDLYGTFGAEHPRDYDWYSHMVELRPFPITPEDETFNLKWDEL